MVNISKFGDSAIKFTFTDNDHYLFNGEIEVPINSLLLVLDESDMVTFKKIDGDPFVSFLIGNSNFASKSDLEDFYKTNMVGSMGGGSQSGVTSGDVQTMIDTSLEDYYDKDEVDAAINGKADSSAVTQEISAAVSGKQDTLIAGSGITISGNVISSEGGNNVIELTQEEYDTLVTSGTVDPSAFYIITDAEEINLSDYYTSAQTQSAINAAVSGKQDTLIAGSGITISGNVISADGGGSITIDPTLDSGSTNAVANSAITNALNSKIQNIEIGKDSFAGSGVTSLKISNNSSSYIVKTFVASINNKEILTGSDYTKANKFSLVETSAFTAYSAATDARISEDEEVTAAGINAVNDKFDGLKLKKLSLAEYNALTVKNNDTLYILVG